MKRSSGRRVRKDKTIPSTSDTLLPSNSQTVRLSPVGTTAEEVIKPFRFLDLPSELRSKVYEIHFNGIPSVLDLDPDNHKVISRKLLLLLVSKQIYKEASHNFYTTHSIRLFPTHPGRFFKTKRPLLARIPPYQRASLTSLQLRLGPGFTNPPRGWVVNDALGLQDTTSVRLLAVFVEVDTSDVIFQGFRRAEDGFYEKFSRDLLHTVLTSVRSILEVQFDAYPSVKKDGDMMRGLLAVAKKHKKFVSWGPERGWSKEKDIDWFDQTELENLSSKMSLL